MRADDLEKLDRKSPSPWTLSDREYKVETLRALLEISSSLRNICAHLYETRESIDYLSSKFKHPNAKSAEEMLEGAI